MIKYFGIKRIGMKNWSLRSKIQAMFSNDDPEMVMLAQTICKEEKISYYEFHHWIIAEKKYSIRRPHIGNHTLGLTSVIKINGDGKREDLGFICEWR